MKKTVLFIFAILIVSILVQAENDTTLSDAKQTLTNIKDTGKNLAGNIPTEKVNPAVETISWLMLGTKMQIGMPFFMGLVFWIILLLIIMNVVQAFTKGIYAFIAGFLITSIAMHSLASQTDAWLKGISVSYFSSISAMITAIVLGAIIIILLRIVKKRGSRAEKLEKAEKLGTIIRTSAEIEKAKLDSYKEEDKD